MKTTLSVTDFLTKLDGEREERKKQYDVETIKLGLESGKVYRFHVEDAWGKVDDKKGDYMGTRFSVDGSPVSQGFTNTEKANVFYLSGISLRNFRARVLRGLPNSESFKPLMVYWDKEQGKAVNIIVPVIPEGGLNIQFVQIEEEGKRYKQIFGETVDSFADTWENADEFVNRMHSEYQKWKDSQDKESGEKLKLAHNILYEMKLISAYPQRTEDGSPGEFMVFNFDAETLDFTNFDKTVTYDRMILNGNSLRTFNRDVLKLGKNVPAKEGDAQVQVAFNKETKEPEFVGVPDIPAEGVWVRFVRVQPEDKQYYLLKGETFSPQ